MIYLHASLIAIQAVESAIKHPFTIVYNAIMGIISNDFHHQILHFASIANLHVGTVQILQANA